MDVHGALADNWSVLSPIEQEQALQLLALGQHHLFEDWEPPGYNDHAKHSFFTQIRELDASIASRGGLKDYIRTAKKLLEASQVGANPFEGFTPEVPTGITLSSPTDPEFLAQEQIGINEISRCGFVLVAGGLGERLGYSDIKVSLPVETVTGRCYLQHYIQSILAIQKKYSQEEHDIPLAIMVSEDTHLKTLALLEGNDYFGMKPQQVTLLKQGKVPALYDNDAHIAKSSRYVVDAKPHGHGDVHMLMHASGTAMQWHLRGVRWCFFFQDTNALAFNTLAAMLGISVSLDLDFNSHTVPRFAKQAVGGIVKLTSPERQLTINVEYNQLDPLLRCSGVFPSGDVNNDVTGTSPFPGNTNQLLIKMVSYIDVLATCGGNIAEFVNPKYANAERTVFKKPARLESMMQDYPKLLSSSARVGFSTFPAWLSYSPVKNDLASAAASIANGVPAGCAMTGECDQYRASAELLRIHGCRIESGDVVEACGIEGVLCPRIVLLPTCVLFPNEIKHAFPHPEAVFITQKSSLVLDGRCIVDALHLDGYLHCRVSPGCTLRINVTAEAPLVNAGHEIRILSADELKIAEEIVRIRGYELRNIDGCQIVLSSDAVGEYIYDGKSLTKSK